MPDIQQLLANTVWGQQQPTSLKDLGLLDPRPLANALWQNRGLLNPTTVPGKFMDVATSIGGTADDLLGIPHALPSDDLRPGTGGGLGARMPDESEADYQARLKRNVDAGVRMHAQGSAKADVLGPVDSMVRQSQADDARTFAKLEAEAKARQAKGIEDRTLVQTPDPASTLDPRFLKSYGLDVGRPLDYSGLPPQILASIPQVDLGPGLPSQPAIQQATADPNQAAFMQNQSQAQERVLGHPQTADTARMAALMQQNRRANDVLESAQVQAQRSLPSAHYDALIQQILSDPHVFLQRLGITRGID